MEGTSSDPYASDGVVYRSENSGTDWTRTLGVSGGACFYALAVNPLTPNIILASGASSKGGFIYRSEDNGLNWDQVLTTSDYFTSLTFHPRTTSIVYALRGWPGYESNTLFRSQDGGDT